MALGVQNVPKNSPVKTIADLKGKKVAFGKGSSAHKAPGQLVLFHRQQGFCGEPPRDELATLAAEATGIDVKSWSTAFARAEFSFGPVTDAHFAQQQQLADTFQALGIIPRKINVRDIVWRPPVGAF